MSSNFSYKSKLSKAISHLPESTQADFKKALLKNKKDIEIYVPKKFNSKYILKTDKNCLRNKIVSFNSKYKKQQSILSKLSKETDIFSTNYRMVTNTQNQEEAFQRELFNHAELISEYRNKGYKDKELFPKTNIFSQSMLLVNELKHKDNNFFISADHNEVKHDTYFLQAMTKYVKEKKDVKNFFMSEVPKKFYTKPRHKYNNNNTNNDNTTSLPKLMTIKELRHENSEIQKDIIDTTDSINNFYLFSSLKPKKNIGLMTNTSKFATNTYYTANSKENATQSIKFDKTKSSYYESNKYCSPSKNYKISYENNNSLSNNNNIEDKKITIISEEDRSKNSINNSHLYHKADKDTNSQPSEKEVINTQLNNNNNNEIMNEDTNINENDNFKTVNTIEETNKLVNLEGTNNLNKSMKKINNANSINKKDTDKSMSKKNIAGEELKTIDKNNKVNKNTYSKKKTTEKLSEKRRKKLEAIAKQNEELNEIYNIISECQLMKDTSKLILYLQKYKNQFIQPADSELGSNLKGFISDLVKKTTNTDLPELLHQLKLKTSDYTIKESKMDGVREIDKIIKHLEKKYINDILSKKY